MRFVFSEEDDMQPHVRLEKFYGRCVNLEYFMEIGDRESICWRDGCSICDNSGLSHPGRAQLKWDLRFLHTCKLISTWSKDPSTKVGAVIVRPDRTVMSLGYNGFPRGMNDSPEAYADREQKYGMVIHAEMNALLHARDPLPLTGCTLYTSGPSCERCVVHMLQAGIRRFVYASVSEDRKERWNIDKSLSHLREVGAAVMELNLEQFEA